MLFSKSWSWAWLAMAMCSSAAPPAWAAGSGVVFECQGADLASVEFQAAILLGQAEVPSKAWAAKRGQGWVSFELVDANPSTLGLAKDWGLEPEAFEADPGAAKAMVASRAEVMLAMMSSGRRRSFSGSECSAKAWADEVELRVEAIGWAARLAWDWPDGEAAKWNGALWDRGTPKPEAGSVADALLDAFVNQSAYGIGCYTATKLVYAHSYASSYKKRGGKDFERAMSRLASDGEPLVDVEPGRLWSFEEDFDPRQAERPGKILGVLDGAAPESFVPGDWVYMLNTDPKSYARTGYEGSNAIYLGGGRFDDYYNDNGHSFSYREKLSEVWQWRHGVFNSVRDKEKIEALSEDDFVRLGKPPGQGGLVLDWRAFPAPLAQQRPQQQPVLLEQD